MQLLCQLGDDEFVFHQMSLIVGAVFLPLLTECLHIPRSLPAQLVLNGLTFGKVQAAVFMHAGAQLPLYLCQLRRRQHGHAETVLHIAPQDQLRRSSLQKR